MNDRDIPSYPWERDDRPQVKPECGPGPKGGCFPPPPPPPPCPIPETPKKRPQPLIYGPGPKYRNVPVDNPMDKAHLPQPFIPVKPHCPPCQRMGVKPEPAFKQPLPPPAMCKPPKKDIPWSRPPMNHIEHSHKYFYTVLFLDRYFGPDRQQNIYPYPRKPDGRIKSWQICADTQTPDIKWLDQHRLYVKHDLPMPITLEMWDDKFKPIVYCPILKKDVCNVTLGDVVVNDSRSIIINFYNTRPPQYNQVFKLAIRNLPDFNLMPEDGDPMSKRLSDIIERPRFRTGIAFIFRRNTLDGLYDLISEFDEAYYHSLDENSDLQYLTEKSCYKDVHFTTKYTNNLQDVLDLIDTDVYKVQYSWENHKKYKK